MARLVIRVIVAALAAVAQPVAAQQVGPANGALVLVGGNLQDPALVHRFLALPDGQTYHVTGRPHPDGGRRGVV